MRNEFEKQVRGKMEELKFIPSQPVWDKIEEQIRHKRDRRRMILWVPVLAILLAGGIWWLNNESGMQNNVSQVPADNGKSVGNNKPLDARENNKSNQEKNIQTTPPVRNGAINSSTVSVNRTNETETPVANSVVQKTKLSKKNSRLAAKPRINAEQLNIHKKGSEVNKTALQNSIASADNREVRASSDDDPMNAARVERNNELNEFRRNEIQYRNTPEIYNLYQPAAIQPGMQTLFITTERPKTPAIVKSRWRFGISGDIGISGEANSLHLFNINADANPAMLNALPPVVYPVKESPVEKSLAFTIGFVAKREITKRFYFSTGLDYNFYSTKVKVGNKINEQNYIGSSFGGPLTSARQSTSYDYYNQFHFISLPVSLEYQLFRKFPLHIHGGVSVQQLLNTNALVYNYSKMMYNKDENSFNKTNVFSNIGLDYALLNKKHTLLLGPELRYSLSSYEKNNKDSHLFSVGLRAQFLFKK